MHLLRGLLVILFAIAMAAPACCCTAGKADAPAHHCCGGGKKDGKKAPHACKCRAKLAKQLDDPPAVPGSQELDLPPVTGWEIPPVSIGQARALRGIPAAPDPMAPRQRLAFLRRLRI